MTDSADVVKQYWDMMLEVAKPYYGNAISVALIEESVARKTPFDLVYLLLPFGGYERATIGYARRNPEFSPEVVKQIRHQTGLRLEKLASLFIIDFSSSLLNVNRLPVTKEFYESLKSPGLPDKFDVVKDPWIDQQLGGLTQLLTDLHQ